MRLLVVKLIKYSQDKINKLSSPKKFSFHFLLSISYQEAARVITGVISSQHVLTNPSFFHDWPEFYDGRTWRIADPQRSIFDEYSYYLAFKLMYRREK